MECSSLSDAAKFVLHFNTTMYIHVKISSFVYLFAVLCILFEVLLWKNPSLMTPCMDNIHLVVTINFS